MIMTLCCIAVVTAENNDWFLEVRYLERFFLWWIYVMSAGNCSATYVTILNSWLSYALINIFITRSWGAHAGHALKWPHGRKRTVAQLERHTLHSRCRSKSTYILKIKMKISFISFKYYLRKSASDVSREASGSGSGVRGLLLRGTVYGLIRFWDTWIGERRGFVYRNRTLPPRGTKPWG